MAEDIRKMFDTKGIKAFESAFEKPDCVLMDSEYCSMGRMIALKASRASGYHYFDSVNLLEEVPETAITMKDVETLENRLRTTEMNRNQILCDKEYQKISEAYHLAVKRALQKGPCLIHDRAVSEEVISLGYNVLSVLVYATDKKNRIERAKKSPQNQDCHTDVEFLTRIQEEDNIRFNWHNAQSNTVWGDKNTYDLCLNADKLGRDFSAEVLAFVMIHGK